jgi:hypothetical protein
MGSRSSRLVRSKKRSAQNQAPPNREFGGYQIWHAVELCLSRFPLRVVETVVTDYVIAMPPHVPVLVRFKRWLVG